MIHVKLCRNVFLILFCGTQSLFAVDGDFSQGRSQDLLRAVAEGRHADMYKLLRPAFLRRAADPNIKMWDDQNLYPSLAHVSPLLLAMQRADRKAVEMLLEAGARFDLVDSRSHPLFLLLDNKALESEQEDILKTVYHGSLRGKWNREKLFGTHEQDGGDLLTKAMNRKRFSFAFAVLGWMDENTLRQEHIDCAVEQGAPAYFLSELIEKFPSCEISSRIAAWLLQKPFKENQPSGYRVQVLNLLARDDPSKLPKHVEGSSLAVFAAMGSEDGFRWLSQFIEVGVAESWWPVSEVQSTLKICQSKELLDFYKKLLDEKGFAH